MRGGPVGRSAVVTVARRRPALATRLACVHAVANRMRGIQGLSHSLGSRSSLPQDRTRTLNRSLRGPAV